MGYSTTLYGVNLDALKAAVGSNDAGLLERLRSAGTVNGDQAAEVDPTRGPRSRSRGTARSS